MAYSFKEKAMRKKMWTDELMVKAIKDNFSIRGVLNQLGMNQTGGNYKTVKKVVERLHVDVSHWMGRGYLKGKKHSWSKKRDLDEILVEHSDYVSSTSLKKRILNDLMIENKCSICGQEPGWKGKPLVMVLDHINGVNDDHRLENLRFVCPNCNSQLLTFAGRNAKIKRFRREKVFCKDCEAEISRSSKSGLCVSCVHKNSGVAQRLEA